MRPLTPPCSLTILKYAALARASRPYCAAGPLRAAVWPMRISPSLTPTAWACAQLAPTAASSAAATPAILLRNPDCMSVSW